MTEATTLDVNLDALKANAEAVVSLVAPGGSSVAAVVKANGYGLGAARVAGAFVEGGAALVAVARLREALELRREQAARPVPASEAGGSELFVMGRTDDGELATAAEEGITLTVYEESQVRILSEAAVAARRTAAIHVKVETGMNRLGLEPSVENARRVAAWAGYPGIRVEGAFSHLALTDEASDRAQAARFLGFTAAVADAGYRIPVRHLCDSIALLRYPEYRLDLVRAGAILYGMPPLGRGSEAAPALRFPARLRSRISRIRRVPGGAGVGYDATYRAPLGGASIGTVPLGYADGYPRRLSNRGCALVRGRRVPVVGLICMDQLTVDLSAVPEAAVGDKALFLGPLDWEAEEAGVGILELARWADTNRNDILAGLSRRVVRRYWAGGVPVAELDYLLPGTDRKAGT